MTVTLHLNVFTIAFCVLFLVTLGWVLCDLQQFLDDRKVSRQILRDQEEMSHLDWMTNVLLTPPRDDLTDPNLVVIASDLYVEAELVVDDLDYVDWHPCVWCDGNVADVTTMHGHGFCTAAWDGDPHPVSPAPVGRHYADDDTPTRYLVGATVARMGLPGTPTGEYRILEG
jgi:hypothetical protein